MIEKEKDVLDEIGSAVAAGQRNEAARLTASATSAGIPAKEIRCAILEGLNRVRQNLMSKSASLPEFLLCIDAASDGLAKLTESKADSEQACPIIVIGVVEGDPHEIGKAIIAGVYRAYGYRVVDLGVQVPAEEFVEGVLRNKADILALSAMMSTTMTQMPDIIRAVRHKSPGTMVMVGGAPLDRQLAHEYGADGYAESAVTLLEETEAVLGKASGLLKVTM